MAEPEPLDEDEIRREARRELLTEGKKPAAQQLLL
jgi:hypothetical protein